MVHQHDQRPASLRTRLGGGVALVLSAHAAARLHDLRALGQELARHVHRLLEQPAGILPQVEHSALRPLAAQAVERGPDLRARLLREAREPQVAHAVSDHERVGHAVGHDDLALERDVALRGVALAPHGDRDLRAFRAAQPLGCVVDREPRSRLPVDLHDLVARAQPRKERRAALDRRDHGRVVLAHAHDHADPAERALGRGLEVGEVLRAQILGVGIKGAHHPLERPVDQLLRLHRVHVVLLDLVNDLHEQVEVAVEIARGSATAHPPPEGEESREQQAEHDALANQDSSCRGSGSARRDPEGTGPRDGPAKNGSGL